MYANDLNPHSYSALCNNAKLNKVEANLKAYNLDAREFITKVTSELVSNLIKSTTTDSASPAAPRLISHVIMNLPRLSGRVPGQFSWGFVWRSSASEGVS